MGKRLLLTFIPVLVLIISAFIFLNFISKTPAGSSIPPGQTHEIVLTENGFTPNEITIKPGDLIKFTTTLNEPFWPASDLHPTHGIYPEFDPQEPIDPDKSWTFQFLKSGRWKFHDHLQPVFKGVTNVKKFFAS